MTKLLLGTGNRKKLEELISLLKGLPFEFVTPKDFPNVREIEEDGKTFEENAVKKAVGFAKQTGLLTLGEDSGLTVDALEGNPGVYSARFAGPEKNDVKNCEKVLRLMESLPENCRGAAFKSVVAIASPSPLTLSPQAGRGNTTSLPSPLWGEGGGEGSIKLIGVTQGEVRGAIAHEMRGSSGFGYDPIFIYGPYGGKTFGEVPSEMKHKVSHRAQAIQKMRKILEEFAKINLSPGG